MKRQIKYFAVVFVLAVVFSVFMPGDARAITKLEQTKPSKKSVTLKWNRSPGEVAWRVKFINPNEVIIPSKTIRPSDYERIYYHEEESSPLLTKTTYTCMGLLPGKFYTMKVYAYDSNGNLLSGATKSIKVKTAVGKIEVISAAIKAEVVNGGSNDTLSDRYQGVIDYVAQEAADGYEVTILNAKGKKILRTEVSKKKMDSYAYFSSKPKIYVTEDLVMFAATTKEQMYKIKMRAYQNYNGKKIYGSWGIRYALKQPVVQYRKNADGSVDFKWKKNKYATGYDLYLFDSKKKINKSMKISALEKYHVKALGKNKTKVKLDKKYLKKGKTYYYMLVPKKKVGKTTYKMSVLYAKLLKMKY